MRKERTYPELVGPQRRAQLVVVAVEVGGRWSEETRRFLSALAVARARSELPLMRKRAQQAWRMRWGGMLACAAARAVASSTRNGSTRMVGMATRWTVTTGTRGWHWVELAFSL